MSSDSSIHSHAQNPFTTGSLYALYARTALPIIFVMGMNGLLTVVDAIFLGRFVGPDALAAVTLVFPAYMLLVAVATLVSGGMTSLLARQLGAGNLRLARAHFSAAHGLALVVSLCVILAYWLFGQQALLLLANGSVPLAHLGDTYLRIMVLTAPLMMVLSLHVDALRNEGFAPVMAAMSLLVSLGNILFNAFFIIKLEMGVAGSAYGTAAAQALAMLIVLGFRHWGPSKLKPMDLIRHFPGEGWKTMLALGAPQSLSFLGISIIAAATLSVLQLVETPRYAETVTAYGIINRLMTFYFLPLIGLAQAMQAILGNNYGASLWHRTDQSLRIATGLAFLYCLGAQSLFMLMPATLCRLFVTDTVVVAEVTRILPITSLMLFAAGPMLMLAMYFQAIGDVTRAAILSLAKTYGFLLPLLLLIPALLGEPGIWIASPLADAMMLLTTALLLRWTSRQNGRKWGLFSAPQKVQP